MKNILLILAILVTIFNGCGNKSNQELKPVMKIDHLTSTLTIGNNIPKISLKDQFDKPQTVSQKTKKIIFVFTKNSGHQVREFLNKKPNNYLSNANIIFIADIHKMPSFIANMIAIPDLQKHKYPILLIKDDKTILPYLNEKYKDYITIVCLDKLKITNITLISDATKLDTELK